ncbi:MAG: hypothetical protein M3R03_09210 [Pseudomonadota bacterium]|nr:hypothetical protein [Pseudomonadota bacterium]
MKHILILAPLALAGCATLFGPTSPFALDRKGETVEFNYAWSAEAAAIPMLVRRLRGDLETSWRAASATAQADRAQAEAAKRSFKGHKFSRRWTTAGQSARLLSLDGQTLIVTGAEHPNYGADPLLWDRSRRAEIKAQSLFASESDFKNLVYTPYCVTLQGERAKRRGSAARAGETFSDCPSPSALSVVPADGNGNRRFDRFRLIAASGIAGSHAEGRYDVAVPVTAAIRAGLKPAYQSSFEVDQPQ